MKRREFITLLGGAAAAWPVAAHAQQPTMSVIGFIDPHRLTRHAHRLAGFRQGSKRLGLCRGREPRDRISLRRESSRTTTGAGGRFGSPPGRGDRHIWKWLRMAAKAATTTIPIVFISSEDPVKLGLVASLARPGGNLTGINLLSAELVAKRLELLRELVPGATRVSVLVNPTGPSSETTLRDALCGCSGHRAGNPGPQRQYQPRNQCGFHNFSARAAQRPFRRHRPLLHHPAHAIGPPGITSYGPPPLMRRAEFAEVGGLMSYGS